jgi:hypothetical protein
VSYAAGSFSNSGFVGVEGSRLHCHRLDGNSMSCGIVSKIGSDFCLTCCTLSHPLSDSIFNGSQHNASQHLVVHWRGVAHFSPAFSHIPSCHPTPCVRNMGFPSRGLIDRTLKLVNRSHVAANTLYNHLFSGGTPPGIRNPDRCE